MSKLSERIQEVMDLIDEEYVVVDTYHSKLEDLIGQQERKIYETALALYPVMEKIKNRNYYFNGPETTYQSSRGPVLKYDEKEHVLYVFDIDKKAPVSVNLYNDEIKNLSYRNLLQEVEFPLIMEGLLMVLNHHDKLKKSYQKSIDGLQAELNEYDEL
ncbi:hypothetical protein AWH48_12100 [Domibacillus aminovorans]|uniref:Uncharacterized protein n=1 Tax=Domibacillus aminovorans TaxID=29332 RepID=A0A177KI64_9BACI|nr:hypothetical protein [Domibacillus aminovorans]OAH53092.1 hypothetical protein AWH48_12100 [Domibacillus aminovorans]